MRLNYVINHKISDRYKIVRINGVIKILPRK